MSTAKTDAENTVSVATVQQRTVRTLASAQLINGLGYAVSVPAGSLLATSIAGSEAVGGFAQTSAVASAAVFALPMARLALTKGRRISLVTGFGLAAIGALIVIAGAVMHNVAIVLIGTFFAGVSSAAGYQARYTATDLATDAHRARALSFVVWGSTIGAVLGPNLLGVTGNLGTALGIPQMSGPYVLTAVCMAITVLVLWTLLRPDPYLLSVKLRGAKGPVNHRVRDGIAHVKRHPRAILAITAISVGHMAMVMVMVMTPVHMKHVDVSLTIIGLVISVHIAGMYALAPVVGWATDRFGRTQVVFAGVLILIVSCIIAGLAAADNSVQLGIGLFLLGLGWSCTLIAGSAMLVDVIPVAERPPVQGFSDLAMNVAGAVGGAIAGVIVLEAGYGWLCAAAVIPVAFLGAMTALPKFRVTG